jgi:3'-5' exonuclease
MGTLIFDIETVGEEWDTLDDTTKAALTAWVGRASKDQSEQERLIDDVKAGLGFSPLTGFIVALGLYDVERELGVVYYLGEGEEEVIDEFTYKPRSEAQLLVEFWAGAVYYDTFVTFNGRQFDVPFLYHRSIVHEIVPTKSLLEGKYPYQQKSCRHIDLQDELTFFGSMTRRPSLHVLCRAYNIASPKVSVSGADVARLFREKKMRDIALYSARDVVATKALYEKWQTYVQPQFTEF